VTNEEKDVKLAAAITTGLAVPALVLGASAAVAAPAQHDVVVDEYDEYLPFAAGAGPCVDWAGTLHEVRSGRFKVLEPGGARHPDEFHTNGVVNGSVELIPDDPALPSYAGTFREKANAIGTVTDEGERSAHRAVPVAQRPHRHGRITPDAVAVGQDHRQRQRRARGRPVRVHCG
jgi:hypothetical protein